MPEYDNTNTISLWKNESDNDKAPILKGSLNIDGRDYKVSIWKRNSDNPKAPVLGGAIEPAEGAASSSSTIDEEIGF